MGKNAEVLPLFDRGVKTGERLISPGFALFSTELREPPQTEEVEELVVISGKDKHRFRNATTRYVEQGDVTGLIVEWRPDGVR